MDNTLYIKEYINISCRLKEENLNNNIILNYDDLIHISYITNNKLVEIAKKISVLF